MTEKKLFFFILISFMMIPVSVFAIKKARKGRIVEINFDDELLIKGKHLGPSLFTLYHKKNIEFGKLIKPRENFLPEMRATRGDIE